MSYKCNIYNITSNFISKGTIFWNTKIVQYWWIFIIIQTNFYDNYISQQEYQEIQTTTLTATKNDTTTWQLHNAMIYTGSYSASNINIMLKYETWPNLKAVYRLIIIMNIQWYHDKIWFLKSKYWKYWHSHSVDNFTFSKDNIFSSFV